MLRVLVNQLREGQVLAQDVLREDGVVLMTEGRELTSPELQPKFYGFSPEPRPELIASYPTGSPALSVSKGLDRDRAVDETGHQIAILGRIGSRPFNLEEMRRLYLGADGRPWTVSDEPSRAEFRAGPSGSRKMASRRGSTDKSGS